jgi:GNAT superfamily N-acetyltransferase
MPPDLVIRPVAADDREDWERLWTAYLDFYETSVAPQVYETSFNRLLTGGPGVFRGALALRDGCAVGLVHYVFHPHMWRIEPVCYLQDLYADADMRGTGIGRALIEHVYAAADAEGAPTVYWMTQDFNATARKLYDRIGTATPFMKYQRPAS